MALLKCCDCGQEISEHAEKCPNCGCPIDIIKNNNIPRGQVLIKGQLYDISELQAVYQKEKGGATMAFLEERYNLNSGESYSYDRVIEDNNRIVPPNLDEAVENFRAANRAKVAAMTANRTKCPFCGSTNVKKISMTGKALSIGTFGLFSKKIGKQWHCNNCKSDF